MLVTAGAKFIGFLPFTFHRPFNPRNHQKFLTGFDADLAESGGAQAEGLARRDVASLPPRRLGPAVPVGRVEPGDQHLVHPAPVLRDVLNKKIAVSFQV